MGWNYRSFSPLPNVISKEEELSYYLKFEGRVAERRGEQRQILIAKTALEQHASHLAPTA